MEDDIDIEEHDVLDNPRIKHMYPYITSIKTEVEDYDEQETAVGVDEDLNTYSIPATFKPPDNNVKSFNNKIIIGSKPCPSPSQASSNTGTRFQGTEELEGNFEEVFQAISDQDLVFPATFLHGRNFRNKIILGSKTPDSPEGGNKVEEGLDLPEAFVLLEDCKNFLEGNPCFCKKCEILFPTHNDLDAHKMAAHSFLVAVSKNKAVKSTSKAPNVDSKSLLCNHCNTVFPNTIALLKHTYELLPGKFTCDECGSIFENDAACKSHRLEHDRSRKVTGPAEMYAICKICSCHFKWTSKLEKHMVIFHGTKEMGDVKRAASNFQCHICNTTLSNSKRYNIHIMNCHSSRYNANYADFEKISKYHCPKCSLCFSSEYSVRIHLAAKHGYLGNVEDSKKIAQSQKITSESKNVDKFLKVPAKSQINESCDITKTRPLPKSTLFKCNKCNIHFLSCISAVLHARPCVPTSKKGTSRCHQCRRTFLLQDKLYHAYQHSISDRLKVIRIDRNILNTILCKCKTCEVCFDEKNLMTFHTDSCNAETPSIQCKECNVWMYLRDLPSHKKIHASGLSAKDFIIIDYVHATIALKEREKTGLIDKFKTKAVKFTRAKPTKPVNRASKVLRFKIKRYDYKSYYYCPTCKCYMRSNKRTDRHAIGQCNTGMSTVTCKSCGLRFTSKGFMNHQMVHKMFPKLKLTDLKFINIQTSSRIYPPFPNFKKCKKCKVFFFSVLALKNHSCHSEESKICAYCEEKFSDLSYKLHVAYHKYEETVSLDENVKETNDEMSNINENIPKLMKKYESLKQVWNILYLCQACDIVIDTYDKVVEHCQDHFCNMQSYNVTIEHCDICDLNFVSACFKRHEKLHLNDDMDKDSFIILEYRYENLLSDTWMDMFQSLTKEQIQLILSKSMYKFTRCVRMKVLRNGVLDLTLYQCGKCRSIVAPNRILDHSLNVNDSCKNSKSFRCSICSFAFAYKSHKLVHEKLHEIRKIDAKSFRIIQFHADKQFSVAEVKSNEINVKNDEQENNPEGLKFIRCQHCGKLINKHKYKSHMSHHYYNRSKSKIKPSKPQQNTQKIHNFYVCIDCKVCVGKDSIKVHECDSGKKKKCVKCSLLFRPQNLAAHYKSHERHNFNRNNMRIMYFDGEVIDKKSARRPPAESKVPNKMITMYQCSQCTICIWRKVNLSNHVCFPESRRFTCEICGVVLRASKKSTHKALHQSKIFNSTNIQLIKFNGRNTKNLKSTNPVPHKRKPPTSHREIDDKKSKIEIKFHKNCVAQEINRYHKCRTCKLLFVTFAELIDHENICETDRDAVKCEDCGLVFHASVIDKHTKLQECKIHSERNVHIYTIEQTGKLCERDSMWICLCVNCDTFNISLYGLRYHLQGKHKSKYAIQTCERCNIKFTSTSYKMHLKLHHEREDIDLSDLSIAAVEETTLAKALQDLPNDDDVVYVDRKTNTEHVETSQGIYSCDECGLNFVNENSLIKHKYKGQHRETHHGCKLCGLNFTLPSLKKHMNIHHANDENDGDTSKADENDSVDESGSRIDDTQSNTTVDHDEEEDHDVGLITPSYSDKSGSENLSIDNVDINDESTKNRPDIYNCDVCGMSFLHPDSLKKHKKRNIHDGVRRKCNVCGLIFSDKSIKRHIALHHKKTTNLNVIKTSKSDVNTTVNKRTSRIVDSNQLNTSLIQDKTKNINTSMNNGNNSVISNPNNSLNETTTENVSNSSTNEEDNSSATISNTVGNSRNVQDNLDTVRNASGRPQDENNAVSNEVLNKNKLFKCNICNVYFLTSEDCSEHTTNHIQLDTFEYIACKICDLQFCCEFLGRHMKSHREKTFSTDDLIVAEYHPSGSGQVKIDTYLFVDRLKAKLVSTTTHFDTEAVDSTTENVSINNAPESTCLEADIVSES